MMTPLAPILKPIANLLAVAERQAARCAWCDAEAGRKTSSAELESHTICPRHLAQTKANLEALRRKEAE